MSFTQVRDLCHKLGNHPKFSNFIIALIIINAITIGLDTSPTLSARFGVWFNYVNNFVLAMFIVEAAFKIVGATPQVGQYFKDLWNDFDFLIIILSLIPAVGSLAMVARLARLMRVLRVIRKLQGLRIIINTLIRSIPGAANVMLLLSIIFYIYGIAGFHLFHEQDPEHWGSLGTSLLTLVQLATLDGWSDVMRIALEHNPFMWIYFISFVLVGGFMVINLLIGVVLVNIGEAKTEELEELKRPTTKEDMIATLKETKKAIEKLESKILRKFR